LSNAAVSTISTVEVFGKTTTPRSPSQKITYLAKRLFISLYRRKISQSQALSHHSHSALKSLLAHLI